MARLKTRVRTAESTKLLTKTIDITKRKDSMSKLDLVPKQCKCGRIVERVRRDAEWVICWECVAKACPPPILKTTVEKTEIGFPRGWKWMKQFVHSDGRVFEEGIENVKLKGTLSPTPQKPKLSRFEKEQKKLEKEKKLAIKFEKKQKQLEKQKKKNAKNIQKTNFGKVKI